MFVGTDWWIGVFTFLKEWIFLISFLAPILGGENAVLALAFLSAQEHFFVYAIILFSFLGMLAIDSFWFLIMKTKPSKKLKEYYLVSEKYKKLERKISEITKGRDALILLVAKALVGTRVIILAYLSLRNMSYKTFMKYNIIPTFIWTLVLVGIGWFAGKGYYSLEETFNSISLGIFFAATLFIIFYAALQSVRKWIEK